MPSTTSSRTESLPLELQHCQPVATADGSADADTVRAWLQQVQYWQLTPDGREIRREFHFNDFSQTIAFVNAVAWIAQREDHHPQLSLGYDHAIVRYTTHATGGLTRNDFICAAKINRLLN